MFSLRYLRLYVPILLSFLALSSLHFTPLQAAIPAPKPLPEINTTVETESGGTGSDPRFLSTMGNDLYLRAFDGIDTELWHYDGSTMTKIDIVPGKKSSFPRDLMSVGNALYFAAANENGIDGELWRVIGNTPKKFDLSPGQNASDPMNFASVGSTLYVTGRLVFDRYLFAVDGDDVTRIDILPLYRSDYTPAALGNALYIPATGATDSDLELWRVVGTTPTKIDINPSGSSSPQHWATVSDALYVTADNGQGDYLFRVMGTTFTPVDFGASVISTIHATVQVGNALYVTGADAETEDGLWRVEGTSATKVNITTNTNKSYMEHLTAVNDVLYLSASDQNGDTELWKVEGTQATKIDLLPGDDSSSPANLVVFNQMLYLIAFDGNGRELWQVNDLTANKIEFFAGEGSGDAANLTASPDTFYFTARGGSASGMEVWRLGEALAPQPINDALVTLSDSAVQGNVLMNDQDPQQSILAVSASDEPAHGNVTIASNGFFTYTPAAGYVGVDTFTYTVMNAYQVTATATVAVVVGAGSTAAEEPTLIVTTPGVTTTQTIVTQDFTVSLRVPADTYSDTLNISDLFYLVYTPVLTSTGSTPDGFRFAGLNFNLDAYVNSESLESANFTTPLLLEITYPESFVEETDPRDLTLLYWDVERNSWSGGGTVVIAHDTENRRITIAIDHLTEFALFVPGETQLFMPNLVR